jgi:FMN-dependent NADH-azoreductase
MKKILILLAVFLVSGRSFSQELNCQVSVTAPQLTGTDKRVFETLQTVIYEFMNNRKWTSANLRTEERIECTVLLTITDRMSTDDFKGTLNLVLRRPVYNSAYNSVLLNWIDKDFQFHYVEFQPLDFAEGTYTSNLTSTLAFYSNIFLGLYFDSFSQNGGSQFFDKAQSIVNAAQNAQETGWKGYESQKNRFWLVENYLNPSNSELRDFSYRFHRLGLDQMYEKVDQGRNEVTESLDLLKTLYNEKPGLFALQLILDAKRDEFVNIYSDQRVPPMEKTNVVNTLKEIDPANGSKYQTILSGK